MSNIKTLKSPSMIGENDILSHKNVVMFFRNLASNLENPISGLPLDPIQGQTLHQKGRLYPAKLENRVPANTLQMPRAILLDYLSDCKKLETWMTRYHGRDIYANTRPLNCLFLLQHFSQSINKL